MNHVIAIVMKRLALQLSRPIATPLAIGSRAIARTPVNRPDRWSHSGSTQFEAKSIRDASRNPEAVVSLDLSGSKDFVCQDIMCGKFGGNCICKLARWIAQTGHRMPSLRHVDLSNNNMEVVPVVVWTLTQVQQLDLSGNRLTDLDKDIAQMTNLRLLKLNGNNFSLETQEKIEKLLAKAKDLQPIVWE
eukprot:m.49687 g.49687  ORF g.49687 m.49687 type:complete len:189 (+) comp21092_c0_seq1:170-736(+)